MELLIGIEIAVTFALVIGHFAAVIRDRLERPAD